jgi:hypothetical protein
MGRVAWHRRLVGGMVFLLSMLGVDRSGPPKKTPHEYYHTDSDPPASSSHVVLTSFNRKAHPTGRMGLHRHARNLTDLHELHKLVFRFIHHLCGDGCDTALLRDPLNFFPCHRTNEVRDVLQSLFRFPRPG